MRARLHLVTNDAVLRAPAFTETARRIVHAHGARVALHLRGHGLDGAELQDRAEAVAAAAAASGARLLVNDRVDVALAAGADGAQLGRRSLPVPAARALLGADAWIGYSAHDPAEAERAVADGADFVIVGTIYPSASHPGREPAGVEAVRQAAARIDRPVVAIGGITPERGAEVRAAGAAGAAVLSGVWGAPDPVAAVHRYLCVLDGGDDADHDR